MNTTSQPRSAAPATVRPGARRPVVVGVDATESSDLALRWAAHEAAARHVPLSVVNTWVWQEVGPWSSVLNRIASADLKRAAGRTVKHATQLAIAQAPTVETTGAVVHGKAVDVLSRRGRDAELLVVGSNHLPAVGRLFAGSVSSALAARADCPVVVAGYPAGTAAEHACVVAGVSGSPGDEQVLRFAFDHASRHGLPLRVLLCWHPPFADAHAPLPEQAHALLAESIAGWRQARPDVEVHAVAVRGHPVDTLVEASASQALLVVGRHARHARPNLVLGSVALGALHHATCPVAVVPTTPARTEEKT